MKGKCICLGWHKKNFGVCVTHLMWKGERLGLLEGPWARRKHLDGKVQIQRLIAARQMLSELVIEVLWHTNILQWVKKGFEWSCNGSGKAIWISWNICISCKCKGRLTYNNPRMKVKDEWQYYTMGQGRISYASAMDDLTTHWWEEGGQSHTIIDSEVQYSALTHSPGTCVEA